MKTIIQKVEFDTPVDEIFALLTNGRSFSKITGQEAVIGKKVGDEIKLFDGWVTGEIVGIRKNNYFAHTWELEGWQDSKVEFTFTKKGDKTQIHLTHTNVPDKEYKDFYDGWEENYWSKIRAALS